MAKLLVVEVSRKNRAFLARAFHERGYVVDQVADDPQAVSQASIVAYDLIVFGPMHRPSATVGICRTLRRQGNGTMMLMLAERLDTSKVIEALDAGMDDCLVAPFHLSELHARVSALLRRAERLRCRLDAGSSLTTDLCLRSVLPPNQAVDLTPREFSLLGILVKNAGRIVRRAELVEHIWGSTEDPHSNVVDVHVRNLRQKLGPFSGHIETVRGEGYLLRVAPLLKGRSRATG